MERTSNAFRSYQQVSLKEDKKMKITFEPGKFYTTTTTKSGKTAFVYQNCTNIRRPLYSLKVDGKTIFARGSLNRVQQTLEQM